MPEIKRETTVTTCRGCNRQFDSAADVCQVPACGFCHRCHITALGITQPHQFNDKDLR